MGAIRLVSPQRIPAFDPTSLSGNSWRLHDHFSARSAAGRLLICTVAAWILAFIYCRQTLWSEPQSSFFNSNKAYDFRYTEHRLQEARDFISTANERHNVSTFTSHNQPVLCAAMASVKRKEVQYLNDTIGSMLSSLTPEERSAVNVRLLFADMNASSHPEWDAPWLNTLDSWGRYNLSEAELEYVRELKARTVQAKGMFDYNYLLQDCYNNTNAPYIAVFEDDIVFAEGWLAKALDALSDLRQNSDPWLFLRLFYTESQTGWDKGVDPWYRNPIFRYVMALTATLSAAIIIKIHCWRLPLDKNSHKGCAVWIMLFCITLPSLFTLLFMIGQDAIMPVNGVVQLDGKGCCTQALIYPREQIPALTNMLSEVKPGPTDLVIKRWANEGQMARYAIAPPVVQHIGIVSTRGMPKKFAQQTFAYRFEDQKPKKLRDQHNRLSRWGIWRAEVFDNDVQ